MYMIFNKVDGSVHIMADILPNEDMLDNDSYAIVEKDWAEIDPTHAYKFVEGVVVDQGEQVIDQIELARMEQEAANNAYKSSRELLYPSVGDQLDSLFKAGVFPSEMAEQIQAVKDAIPKPV
jgi:hypothetical protein